MFITARNSILIVLFSALVLTTINIYKDIKEHSQNKTEMDTLNVRTISK